MADDLRDQLIALCRYYKGGQECQNKDPNAKMCWMCEQYWVEQTTRPKGRQPIATMLDEYIKAGLRTFEQYDKIPATLKAVLFNRYCQYNDRIDIPGFKRFYLEQYHK